MYYRIKSRLDLVYFLHNHLFSFSKARPSDFIRVVDKFEGVQSRAHQWGNATDMMG